MSEIHLNKTLHDKPDWVYDDITMRGEYLSIIAADNFNEDVQYDESDPVRLESILALQSLAMGSLRHAARVKKRGDADKRRHGFSILAESSQSTEAYDGAIEEYMTYRIAKNGFADWSMRVRFRSNERVYEQRQSSSLDDYYFTWRRGVILFRRLSIVIQYRVMAIRLKIAMIQFENYPIKRCLI